MRLLTLGLTAALAGATLLAQERAGAPPSRHVLLVTIDGLRGDYLGDANRYQLEIPTLRRLMAGGARSDRTFSVFPTLTGAAHTSLVTGVGAGRHGILGNNRFDPSVWSWTADNYDAQPPYRDHADIKTATLWSAARAKGYTTAAVNWPQTAGGPIDYRLDVRLGAPGVTRAEKAGLQPGAWASEIEKTLGTLTGLDLRMADHLKALVCAEILQRHKPALLAVHFTLTDAVQHANGPGTPAALTALEETDANVGVVLSAFAAARLSERGLVVVTGDHGFLNLHTQIAINLPLVEAGLIGRDAAGRPEWTAIVAPNRGLGSLYVRDRKDRRTIDAARAALNRYAARYPRRFRVLERNELDRLGADPDAVLGIEPFEGFVLDARLSPPFAMPHARAAGHGYRPELPGMETGLIIAGAGVRPGVVLPVSSTIDVAPTIALILGLDLPDAEGQPIVGIFDQATLDEVSRRPPASVR